MDKIDWENEEEREKTKMDCRRLKENFWNSRSFFKIKIHTKNKLNKSIDAKFNVFPHSWILIQKINTKNGEFYALKKSSWKFHQVSSKSKIYSTKIFNGWFDTEFNALPHKVNLIEKNDLENAERNEKKKWNVTDSKTIPHHWRVFFIITVD